MSSWTKEFFRVMTRKLVQSIAIQAFRLEKAVYTNHLAVAASKKTLKSFMFANAGRKSTGCVTVGQYDTREQVNCQRTQSSIRTARHYEIIPQFPSIPIAQETSH
ncbi:hypothetical protein PC120_g109 [Phytophthora cactorum]|nr:hypothetical protein PC120_g109 [Phytophthora cactorum]